jgi:hypothetical protein
VPARPVQRQGQRPGAGTEQPEHPLGEEPLVEADVAQEAVEARESAAELNICEAGELAGDGEARNLRGLAEGSDEGGAALLLRAAEKA